MSAAESLKLARAIDIHVGIDGDDLVLKASAPPPLVVLELLSRHKAGIVTLLRPTKDGWSPEDWQVFFDERASIIEFDGGLPRTQAEVRAFDCCVAEWLNRNPTPSAPGRCLSCGDGEHTHDPILPYGADTSGHAWVHSHCWATWYAARKAEAIAALKGIGITTPAAFSDDQHSTPQAEASGSSAFRLSTNSVSTPLAGSCFSSESAPQHAACRTIIHGSVIGPSSTKDSGGK